MRARPLRARPPRAILYLGAVLTAPGSARAWTREILWEWWLTDLVDTAELVVSEMITNSVNASQNLDSTKSPVIRLILTFDRGELAVLVRDDLPGAPRRAHPDEDDEGGRGLLLVETLSARFGWHPLEGGPGKVTWAVLQAG